MIILCNWRNCSNINVILFLYIFFQLAFRMMNILLPAYSRNFTALHRAGLITATDERENQELENLVLRERAVVWADQERLGQLLKSEANEAGSAELELAPVLSFSHLLYHSSSPCSKSAFCPLYSSFNNFFILLFMEICFPRKIIKIPFIVMN